MEGTAIVVEVRVDPDDLKQGQAFVKRLPTSRRAQRIVRLAVAVHLAVAVVFFVGMYSMGQDHWGWWLAFGAYVAQPLITPFVQRLSWPAFAETFNGRLTFEPSGLTMDRPGYSSHVAPSALVDVMATDEYLFVCFGPARVWVAPRRCFKNSNDFAAAAALLREMRERGDEGSASTAQMPGRPASRDRVRRRSWL